MSKVKKQQLDMRFNVSEIADIDRLVKLYQSSTSKAAVMRAIRYVLDDLPNIRESYSTNLSDLTALRTDHRILVNLVTRFFNIQRELQQSVTDADSE